MANPAYLQGRHLTVVSAAPVLIADNGAVTVGTPVSLSNSVMVLQPTLEMETVDIRPVNSLWMNMVPTGIGVRVRLEVLQGAVGAQAIVVMAEASFHINLTWVVGGEGYNGYFTRGAMTWGISNRGENVLQIELEPVNLGDTPQLLRSLI